MAPSMQADVEIKSPADRFFKRLSKELHHAPNASDLVHGFEVHEGNFETHGSIISWSYSIDGKKENLKEKFEIDEANMAISMVAVGGHLLERYKSYKHIVKVIPKDDKPTMVNVKVVYEKFKETDPRPIQLPASCGEHRERSRCSPDCRTVKLHRDPDQLVQPSLPTK